MTTGVVILADVESQLTKHRDDYQWMVDNTAWHNVEFASTHLQAFGADLVHFDKLQAYIEQKLSDAVLTGPNVITSGSVKVQAEDIVGSLRFAASTYRMFPVTSMEVNIPGGILRSTVAIVVAKKGASGGVGTVVYRAKYDIKAKNNAVWHNRLDHIEKAKGWAIYKAFEDFKRNCDTLLLHINNTAQENPVITYRMSDGELLASF